MLIEAAQSSDHLPAPGRPRPGGGFSRQFLRATASKEGQP